MIAVIRIRGQAGVTHKIEETLQMLRLHKSNHLVVINDNPSMRKMVEKVKDFVTYGDITEADFAAIIEKRARSEGNHKLTPEFLKEKKIAGAEDIAKKVFSGKHKISEFGIEPVFRLNPPKKGHERGGIKKPFKSGGALGNRGKEISELIMRMI